MKSSNLFIYFALKVQNFTVIFPDHNNFYLTKSFDLIPQLSQLIKSKDYWERGRNAYYEIAYLLSRQ